MCERCAKLEAELLAACNELERLRYLLRAANAGCEYQVQLENAVASVVRKQGAPASELREAVGDAYTVVERARKTAVASVCTTSELRPAARSEPEAEAGSDG